MSPKEIKGQPLGTWKVSDPWKKLQKKGTEG